MRNPSSFTGGNLGPSSSSNGYKITKENNYKRQSNVNVVNQASAVSFRKTHHIPAMQKLYLNIRSYFIVRGVKSAMNEVEQFKKGIKKSKTLDELLNEI